MPATGQASHDAIAASASAIESGRSNARGLVDILRNAHSVTQANRTSSFPESIDSSHDRLDLCCVAPELYAYSSILASIRITDAAAPRSARSIHRMLSSESPARRPRSRGTILNGVGFTVAR